MKRLWFCLVAPLLCSCASSKPAPRVTDYDARVLASPEQGYHKRF